MAGAARSVPLAGTAHITSRIPSAKLALVAVLVLDGLFFGALLVAYALYRGESLTGPFPHQAWLRSDGAAGPAILDLSVSSVSAFVLLLSAVAASTARDALAWSRRRRARLWTLATATLGLLFLGFQATELASFAGRGLSLQANLFGSTFLLLLGAHAVHAGVGVAWLLRASVGGREGTLSAELAVLYWNFVTVVWIVIFSFVYLIAPIERFA